MTNITYWEEDLQLVNLAIYNAKSMNTFCYLRCVIDTQAVKYAGLRHDNINKLVKFKDWEVAEMAIQIYPMNTKHRLV